MKPLFVHNTAGEKKRLNPMQVVGWTESEFEIAEDRFGIGTLLAMAAGPPVQIRESAEQFDWMFERATEGAPMPGASLDERLLDEEGQRMRAWFTEHMRRGEPLAAPPRRDPPPPPSPRRQPSERTGLGGD